MHKRVQHYSTGFGEVYDHQVLGPLGYSNPNSASSTSPRRSDKMFEARARSESLGFRGLGFRVSGFRV